MGSGEGKTVLTNSSLSCFKTCARKYYWRYCRELELLNKPEALGLGNALHGFLEAFYRRESYTPDGTLSAKSRGILAGVVDSYPHLYAGDFDLFEVIAVEKAIEGEILNPETGRPARGYSFGGKIDALVQLKADLNGFKAGDLALLEHKSACRVDENYLDRLELDSQIRLYSLYLEREMKTPIRGVLYNIIIKPGIRQRKEESVEMYAARLQAAMGQVEQYQRRHIRIPDHHLQETERELWEMKVIIARARQEQLFPRNARSCFDFNRKCDYFSLCTSPEPKRDIDALGLYRHVEANVELVGASGELLAEAEEPF